jgi:hypothetical protein
MISEQRIGKNIKESDGALVVRGMLDFVSRYSHKQLRNSTMLTGLQVNIGKWGSQKEIKC